MKGDHNILTALTVLNFALGTYLMGRFIASTTSLAKSETQNVEINYVST